MSRGKSDWLPFHQFALAGLLCVWVFFIIMAFMSYDVTGDFSRTVICFPFLFIINIFTFLILLLSFKDAQRKRFGRPGYSPMLIGSLAMLFVGWILFILFYPSIFIDPEPKAVPWAKAWCISFVVIITILGLMFTVYELKKPWKHLVYPSGDSRAASLFEPTSIHNSPKTERLRRLIITFIGLAIALVIFVVPGRGTVDSSDFNLFFPYVIFGAVPAIMIVVIILFALYVPSKYNDEIEHFKEIRRRGWLEPAILNPPYLEEEGSYIDFKLEDQMERKRL